MRFSPLLRFLVGFFLGLLLVGWWKNPAAAAVRPALPLPLPLPPPPPPPPRREGGVLCWVPVRNYTDNGILKQIQQTWGQSCDLLVFVAHRSNALEETVKLDYPLDRDLWNMIHPGWAYVYETYGSRYEWFAKVDDDSYFSGSNMRHLGLGKNASGEFYYLGHALHAFYTPKSDQTGQFNLGGAYVVSQFTLLQLGPHLPTVNNTRVNKCRSSKTWAEDVMFANCLRANGLLVYPNNSRDAHRRNHFMLADPKHALHRNAPQTDEQEEALGWEFKGVPRNISSGVRCCASRPVSWHSGKDNREASRVLLHYLLDWAMVDPLLLRGQE